MSQEKKADSALFSRAYLRPAASQSDSSRFRTRLYAAWEQVMSPYRREIFQNLVRSKLGITIPESPYGGAVLYSSFFDAAELRDVLDSISIVLHVLHNDDRNAKAWIATVRCIFQEEAMGYTLNDHGAVRYLVDEDFERTRVSTIEGLGQPKLSAVRAAVETAFSKLDKEPFQTKDAVRSMFEAVETLCKVLWDHNDDLDEGIVRKRIQPVVSRVYGALDASAQSFAEQMVVGLGKWVNAAHKYRHGPKAEEPHDPPLELAVMFLSQGAAHIRFLIDVRASERSLQLGNLT